MAAAAIGQDAGHADDHRHDEDDDTDNDDHDVLRGSELLTDAGGPGRHVRAVCRSTVLAVLSGARTGGTGGTGGGGAARGGTPGRGAGPGGPAGTGRPAGTAGPGADQVEDEQQDGRADDGGEPGRQVEEPVQGVDVEQFGGGPAAAKRPEHADHAGQDEAL